MGDGAKTPTNVIIADLTLAIADLKKLRADFQNEVIKKFDTRMTPYSYDNLANSKSKNIARGATYDWTNPFGRFHEADRILVSFDNAHRNASQDLTAILNHFDAVITALQKTRDQYVLVENNNRQDLSKQDIKDIFTASGLPSSTTGQR